MTKDPAEIVTVTFDFSGVATACAAPVVSISVIAGRDDAGSAGMLSGAPQIDGTSVLQRLIGGIDGNTYKLRCQIDDADGERFVVADTVVVGAA